MNARERAGMRGWKFKGISDTVLMIRSRRRLLDGVRLRPARTPAQQRKAIEPMEGVTRLAAYALQNHGPLTPRQRRRMQHKHNRLTSA